MSTKNVSSQSPYMRKKKTELIADLQTAENLLLEKHEELLTCQDELTRIISERTSTSQEEPFANERRELSDRVELLTHEMETAKTSLEATTRKLEKTKEELEKNREELATARATINRQKKARETVPTSSYSFRLDVYPRSEGTYQSRIEHLLSGERQPLDGLDLDTIGEFIGNYFPIQAQDEPEPVLSAPEPAVQELNIQVKPTKSINAQYTPFELEINIAPTEHSQPLSSTIQSKVSIYSKDLESGASTLLGIIDETLEELKGPSSRTLNAIGLPEGVYRIDVVSSFTTVEENPLPIASIQEGTFIQITR